jgi:hypothetical protein
MLVSKRNSWESISPSDTLIISATTKADLAARVGTASDELSYGENTAVWFEDGRKILDYTQSDGRFNGLSFKDSLKEQAPIVDEDALFSPLAIMQSLSEQWRKSAGGHSELVFYVYNC